MEEEDLPSPVGKLIKEREKMGYAPTYVIKDEKAPPQPDHDYMADDSHNSSNNVDSESHEGEGSVAWTGSSGRSNTTSTPTFGHSEGNLEMRPEIELSPDMAHLYNADQLMEQLGY